MILKTLVGRKNFIYAIIFAPFFYMMIPPLVILDIFTAFFQAVIFPVCGITKAERGKYVHLDRGKVKHLPWIDRFHCNYCGYANGVLAWAREVAFRVEQYWCPIKHIASSAQFMNGKTYVDQTDPESLGRLLESQKPKR